MSQATEKVFLYEKVINRLMEYINANRLGVGDAIPPERELAQMFSCNYHTVRKAVQVMIERSLLERKQGRGTFIRAAVDNVTTRAVRRVSFSQTNLLGVIVPTRSTRFASRFMLEFFRVASREGYELVVTPVADFDAASLLIPDRLQSQGCRAVIILHNADGVDSGYLGEFVRMCEVPVVLSQRIAGFEELGYDSADNFGLSACEEAVFACNYFNSQDFRDISMLVPAGSERPGAGNIKASVYYDKMLSFGLAPRIIGVAPDFSQLDRVVADLARLPERKAVICQDDNYAMHFMMAVLAAGYRIPRDFAVLGCNGDEDMATLPIPLSTIRFPYEYLVHSIIDKARRLMGDELPLREVPMVEPVVRSSCGGRAYFKSELDSVLRSLVGSVRFESKNYARKR